MNFFHISKAPEFLKVLCVLKYHNFYLPENLAEKLLKLNWYNI